MNLFSKKYSELKVTRVDAAAGTMTVQFAGSPKDYALAMARGGKSLDCKDPKGTEQTFKREW